jgi:hypothetical protein
MSTYFFLFSSKVKAPMRNSDSCNFTDLLGLDRTDLLWSGEAPADNCDLSFVIPAMNEESTLEELTDRIIANIPSGMSYEVIFIDDGSKDNSWQVIKSLARLFPQNIRGVKFRANRGKAAALQVGFNLARGKYIFTMDADLQDDPNEIPRFLSKLNDGFDLVSGWKQVRHDPWHKVWPSRIFNQMLSRMSKVNLHDHNCGFKCYRSEVAKSIRLFGELHRMVPSLAGMQGFRVSEIVVTHHPRRFGQSKYGIERFIRGFSDMLTMGFLRVYRERPSHFANAMASAYLVIAACLVLIGIACGPFETAGLLCCLVALCFAGFAGLSVMAGLFSELMIRNNHRSTSPILEETRSTRSTNFSELASAVSLRLDSHRRVQPQA